MDKTNKSEYDAFRQLAFDYFNGIITDEGETVLAQFVNTHDPDRLLMRRWEREWTQTYVASADTDTAWQHLASAIGYQKPTARRRWRIPRKALLVAAAAAVLAFVFIIGDWFGSHSSGEAYFCSTAPYGSTATTLLPDGSRVTLNAGSTIKYSNRFDDSNRRVVLSGEAYFEVSRHNGAKFIVKTDGYDVEVKGTKFYVSAYSGDDYVSTTLVKGSVAVNYRDTCYMLHPGERAVLNRATSELRCSTVERMSNGWQKGFIDCDDIALADLRRIIERKYNVSISIANKDLAARRLYISLHNNETIDEVLDALRRSLGVRVTRKGRNVRIDN